MILPPVGCDTKRFEGRTRRREGESLNPFLAHNFGFAPGLAQFVTIPTYIGVIGALELVGSCTKGAEVDCENRGRHALRT